MRNMLYYLPQLGALNADVLAQYGLTRVAFAAHKTVNAVLQNGPDGKAGTLVMFSNPCAQKDPEFRFAYSAGSQTWNQNADGSWCGFYTDGKPGPDDLARANMVPGDFVELRDGNKWVVPAVRLGNGGLGVPRGLSVSSGGELIQEDLPEYSDVCAAADTVFDFCLKEMVGAERSMMFLDAIKYASCALSLNYRIDANGANALKLFTTENVIECCRAMVDYNNLRQALLDIDDAKKNEQSVLTPESTDTECGPVAY